MIGDLTSQPEPIVIRLFSQDGKLLNDTAPRVADAIGKIQIGKSRPVVDVLDGVENTISGPAVTFQVNPTVAARAGFTLEEVAVDASAVLEGEPAARSEEHTSELQSRLHLVCRLLLEKKKHHTCGSHREHDGGHLSSRV